jgi:predicted dehydrogenase
MAPRTSETIKEEALPQIQSDIKDFYRNFVATIDGREKLLVSPESVMRNMKLMEAIFSSAKKGKPLSGSF